MLLPPIDKHLNMRFSAGGEHSDISQEGPEISVDENENIVMKRGDEDPHNMDHHIGSIN